MDEKFHFFPRDITFWLYHWVCLSLLVFSHTILAAFFQKEYFVFTLLGFILWLPLFTLATLCFRFFYKKNQWYKMGMSKLIPFALAFALFSSFIVTTLILVSMAPLFLSNYFVIDSFYNTSISYVTFISRLVSLNTIQSQLFMSAWIFIYVSVTSDRAIKEASSVNLRLENSLKEARISSLSNQLNPHLLFNTLNNIRFMVYDDPSKADDMITSLSEILRYSLKKSLKEKVTIREEWNVVQRYLEIVKMQSDERIKFDLSIDNNLLSCLVPPMAIQMLAENAIKHGLEKVRDGEFIIKVEEQGEHIVIKVTNTTPKITTEHKPGTGTGLENIRKRLGLLYGQGATMTTDELNGVFNVNITIPKEKA